MRDRYYIITRQPDTLEILRAPWDLPAELVVKFLHWAPLAQVVAHGDFEYLCKDFHAFLFLEELARPYDVGFSWDRQLLGFFADLWAREEHASYHRWLNEYWDRFPEAA